MVDQANEWLPLITPGPAVDGVRETDRGRGTEIGRERETFSRLITLISTEVIVSSAWSLNGLSGWVQNPV